MELLEKESQTFESRLMDLVKSDSGKFAVVYGDEILGIFETQGDALQAGYSKCGAKPFLVKQILAVSSPLSFASNLFA